MSEDAIRDAGKYKYVEGGKYTDQLYSEELTAKLKGSGNLDPPTQG